MIYLKKLQRSFSYALPGSMYEVSPDFGMITQAWNIYGVAVPIVNYFFGITPEAYNKTVKLSPQLPTDWPEATIDNVTVGNNSLRISIRRQTDHVAYDIFQTNSDWSVVVDIAGANKVIVNNEEQDIRGAGHALTVKGAEIHMQIFR
jgi:hypothetical protein